MSARSKLGETAREIIRGMFPIYDSADRILAAAAEREGLRAASDSLRMSLDDDRAELSDLASSFSVGWRQGAAFQDLQRIVNAFGGPIGRTASTLMVGADMLIDAGAPDGGLLVQWGREAKRLLGLTAVGIGGGLILVLLLIFALGRK